MKKDSKETSGKKASGGFVKNFGLWVLAIMLSALTILIINI